MNNKYSLNDYPTCICTSVHRKCGCDIFSDRFDEDCWRCDECGKLPERLDF